MRSQEKVETRAAAPSHVADLLQRDVFTPIPLSDQVNRQECPAQLLWREALLMLTMVLNDRWCVGDKHLIRVDAIDNGFLTPDALDDEIILWRQGRHSCARIASKATGKMLCSVKPVGDWWPTRATDPGGVRERGFLTVARRKACEIMSAVAVTAARP